MKMIKQLNEHSTKIYFIQLEFEAYVYINYYAI